VDDEDDGRRVDAGGPHGGAERVHLTDQRPLRTMGVVRIETGQRHREGAEAAIVEVSGDLVPGPTAEPVAGRENEHGSALSVVLHEISELLKVVDQGFTTNVDLLAS